MSSSSGTPVAIDPANSPAGNSSAVSGQQATVLAVLVALGMSHLLNDLIQAVLPALYPDLKKDFHLSYTQIGTISLTFQLTASLLQPLVGMYADRRPQPFSLAIGMGFTLFGIMMLSVANSYSMILIAAALTGLGSSIFHPEASRVARMAAGGRHGFAQSMFQVGGNSGTALGPLLVAFVFAYWGQIGIAVFGIAGVIAMILLLKIGAWYQNYLVKYHIGKRKTSAATVKSSLSRRRVAISVVILLILVFSKYIYLVSLTNYYTFYLIETFGVSTTNSKILLAVFLGAIAAGTFIGGPIGDRIGFKAVIWVSILGVLPFTLVLPHVGLFWTVVLTVPIGVILASAFSAIIVFAQELLPNRVGMVAGLFFGFAFGMSGVGALLLGRLAEDYSIQFVYQICAFLPIIGLLTAFLPNLNSHVIAKTVVNPEAQNTAPPTDDSKNS